MEYLDILEKLHSSPCWVTFKKVNGDMRTMWCTLQKEYLPLLVRLAREQQDIEEVLVKPEDEPKAIAVWDLEKEAWRSFRISLWLDLRSTAIYIKVIFHGRNRSRQTHS